MPKRKYKNIITNDKSCLEKTSEAFVQNPLNTAYPDIIYRTGDIGRYNEHGELILVSRKEYQKKHMCHRIELGDGEANVTEMEAI